MTTVRPGAPHRPGARPAAPSRWLALALLAFAQLMLVLDITVVNVGAQGGTRALSRINTRIVAVTGLALAAAGYAIAAGWQQPAAMVTGLSVAALGIGATFVTAFTASLTDAAPAEAGLRSALVNTFHELGGAAGVAVLSSAVGAGLVAARLASHDFTRAFTVGAVIAAIAVVTAAVLVPAVRRSRPSAGATDLTEREMKQEVTRDAKQRPGNRDRPCRRKQPPRASQPHRASHPARGLC